MEKYYNCKYMSKKKDGLGFQIYGHTVGRDIAQAWDYCWILLDKRSNATLYCFGTNKTGFYYNDGDPLNPNTVNRLSMDVHQMKRVFFDPAICSANGTNHESESWLYNFNGVTMDTFLHKNRETSVVFKTTSAVHIPDTTRYEHGTFSGLHSSYLPQKKNTKKGKNAASNNTAMSLNEDDITPSSQNASTLSDLYSQGETSAGTHASTNSSNRMSSSSSNEDSLVVKEKAKVDPEKDEGSGDEEVPDKYNSEQQKLARATVFKKVNLIYKLRGNRFISYGKLKHLGSTSPTHMDWKDVNRLQLTTPEKKTFEKRIIMVEGVPTDDAWHKHLFSKREGFIYFYNRTDNNLTPLLESKEDGSDSEDEDHDSADDVDDKDDVVNAWANGDFSSFSDFNLVWYLHCFQSLRFGITPVTHKRTLANVDTVAIRNVEISVDRLTEIADLPLEVDKDQKGRKWTKYLQSKKNGYFWFFNRHEGTITKTSTSCRFRGGFLTRNQAAMNGIKVSTMTEMNNVGKCFEHRGWPREPISGVKGCCAPIAAYYICFDVSVSVIDRLKTQLHQELSISESSSIFVTDGTYKIVQVINQNMSSTFLRQIFPTTEVSTFPGFSNRIFGDRHHAGKFLIELRDEVVQSAIGISHFVSLDTEKLEIYDPMSAEGAIVTQRSSDGNCLFLETLQLKHSVKVFHIWKLLEKPKRDNCKMLSMEEIDYKVPKKKKRRGQKRPKSYVPRKI